MSAFTRSLKFTLPMMRGHDVVAVQRRLRALGITDVSQPDGLFGPATARAIKEFQRTHGLKVDGVAGPITIHALFKGADEDDSTVFDASSNTIKKLMEPHRRFDGSVVWAITDDGVSIEMKPPVGTTGDPKTVTCILDTYGEAIRRWSDAFKVPAELIIATICAESGGNPAARRNETGFTNEEDTPHRVSIGLMQTLISTARSALKMDDIDGEWLLDPDNSIRAGTAYIALQSRQTMYDPPVVACAYNAGGVYFNDSKQNRWRMRQFPIGTSEHADRYVKWFNDCFRVFDRLQTTEADHLLKSSWYILLHQKQAVA